MKVGIVTVPYISTDKHSDLAIQTYKCLHSKHETYRIAVVNKLRNADDASVIQFYNDRVVMNDENIVSRAWNIGITSCLLEHCDVIVIPNLDIICTEDYTDKLIEANKDPNVLVWSGMEDDAVLGEEISGLAHLSGTFFSFFAMKPELERICGLFDENFIPAYFEDNDMSYRISLAKKMSIKLNNLKYTHIRSQTVKNDKEYQKSHWTNFQLNQDYYLAKWGGLPGHEQYRLPFNGQTQSEYFVYNAPN